MFSFLGGGEGVLLYFIFCLVPLINGIAPSHRIFLKVVKIRKYIRECKAANRKKSV